MGSLSRRFLVAGTQQIGTQTAHRFRVADPEGGRLPDEPEKMPLGPAAGVRVSRTSLEYPGSQGFLTRGQESGVQTSGRQATGESQPGLSLKFSGKGDLRMESSPFGKTTLASFSDVNHQRRWWTQPPTEGLSLKAHSADLSMTTAFYGRMGCDVGPQVSQWCLVQ